MSYITNPTGNMSTKESHIMQACVRVCANGITKKRAAEGLGMSARNFYRRYDRWVKDGERGLIHRSKGKSGNNRHSDDFKERVLTIVENDLPRYNAVHATEVLCDEYNIRIHPNTLRRWIRECGDSALIAEMKGLVSSHRQWRARKESFGEMLQGLRQLIIIGLAKTIRHAAS